MPRYCERVDHEWLLCDEPVLVATLPSPHELTHTLTVTSAVATHQCGVCGAYATVEIHDGGYVGEPG
jgi:hypothetical protein